MTDQRDRLTTALADRYTIQREIGQGGMATVYLSHDVRHDRQVAIKVLRPELASALGPERFLHEIKIAARLQHPHILPLHDSGDVDGFLYYVMPYVDGESLREKLTREQELPVADAVRILRDVVDALAKAHSQGVVHRDIKPDNVMLSGRHALVTDFGVAKAVSEATGRAQLTTAGVALGTPAYMAPEQAAADPHIDHRADVYAVGVLAYEMLTGRPPFTGATAQQVLSAHVTEAPRPVTQHRTAVPPQLAQVVMRCLEKKPADRWQSAEELLPQLEALATPSLGVTPTETRPLAAVSDKSIAVLPFANMSADPENEYFSDGITEDIITHLSKISAFKVISRTSSMRYKQTEKSMREIAGELEVATLLEGSVRRAGNRLRITAQLIDAASDRHLWAESYDRELTDVFAIQSEVAQCVATALETALLPVEQARIAKRPTADMEAYDLYLLGRHHAAKRNDPGLARAVELLEQAIEKDPTFAEAYAALADAHALSAKGFRAVPAREAAAAAKEAALKALELDESLAEAHTALGHIVQHFEWDFPRARQEFERAIELNPSSAEAHQRYADLHLWLREFEEALAETTIAGELDPLSITVATELAWPDSYLGNHERARQQYLRVLQMDPTFALARYNLAWTYERTGDLDKAIPEYEEAVRQAGGNQILESYLAAAYARVGRTDEARAILAKVTEQAAFGYEPYVAYMHEALGEREEALEWLERGLAARAVFLLGMGTEWMPFDSIRDDPRFTALLEKMGLRVRMGGSP